MKPFFPATGSEEEWNAAYYRLGDYLRALHVENQVHQSQIILPVLQVAAEKHARDPGQSPTTLAMEEVDAVLEQWFARILPGQPRALVMGCVALLISTGAEKWPAHFLANDVPVEFQQVMRENEMRAGPDLQISSMVSRPLDVPLVGELLKDSEAGAQKGAVLVGVLTAVTIIAAAAFFFNH